MGSFVFSILFTIALVALVLFRKKLANLTVEEGYGEQEAVTVNLFRPVALFTAMMALVLFAASFLTQVEEGTRSIVKTFGRASDTALAPGLNVILPWQNTVPMSVRAEVFQQTYPCQSQDLQRMDISIATIYQRDPDKIAEIYKDVMMDSRDRTVKPAAKHISKARANEFDAPDLIGHRTDFSDNVEADMGKWLSDYNLIMLGNSVANIDFDPAYDKKVEKKVIALEQAQQATHDLRAEVAMAKIERLTKLGEALAKKQEARGSSESTRIAGDAEAYATETLALAEAFQERAVRNAEAERATLISKALSDGKEVILFETLRKWDGSVPRWLSPGEGQSESPYGFLAQVPQLKKHDVTAADLAGEGGLGDLDLRIDDFIKGLEDRAENEANAEIKAAPIQLDLDVDGEEPAPTPTDNE
jgi:regulator of protease activity HflC (stomatin/prohibitin superfamily)